MLIIRYSKAYRKAYRKFSRSGRFPKEELEFVVKIIQRQERLDVSCRDHELTAEFIGHRECHIRPDLLLIYRIEDNKLVLVLVNLGSHEDLFG